MEKKTLTMTLLGGGAILLAGIGSYAYFQWTLGSDPEREAGTVAAVGSFSSGTASPSQPVEGPQAGGFQTSPPPAQPFAGPASGTLALPPAAASEGGKAPANGKRPLSEERVKQMKREEEKRARMAKNVRSSVARHDARRKEREERTGRAYDPALRQKFPDVAIVPENRVIPTEGQEPDR